MISDIVYVSAFECSPKIFGDIFFFFSRVYHIYVLPLDLVILCRNNRYFFSYDSCSALDTLGNSTEDFRYQLSMLVSLFLLYPDFVWYKSGHQCEVVWIWSSRTLQLMLGFNFYKLTFLSYYISHFNFFIYLFDIMVFLHFYIFTIYIVEHTLCS